MILTIGFLETSACTTSTVFLWLAPTRIRYQEVTVVFKQSLTDLIFGALVDIFGMVGNDGLGNGSADSINLSRHTSTLHSDSDIKVRELVLSYNQHRLEDLQPKNLGFDVLDRLPIDLNETPALLCECNSCGGLFPVMIEVSKIRVKQGVRMYP